MAQQNRTANRRTSASGMLGRAPHQMTPTTTARARKNLPISRSRAHDEMADTRQQAAHPTVDAALQGAASNRDTDQGERQHPDGTQLAHCSVQLPSISWPAPPRGAAGAVLGTWSAGAASVGAQPESMPEEECRDQRRQLQLLRAA
jgi:hypothetical protein